MHVYIKKNQISIDNMLGAALIDMYGRWAISEKNVFLWTSMIAAYAMAGHAQKAIDLFLEMEETGTKPDQVTFIALLSACSHGGLVDEGYDFLSKMSRVYNIKPKIQHYGCMVDLLGRAGHLGRGSKLHCIHANSTRCLYMEFLVESLPMPTKCQIG